MPIYSAISPSQAQWLASANPQDYQAVLDVYELANQRTIEQAHDEYEAMIPEQYREAYADTAGYDARNAYLQGTGVPDANKVKAAEQVRSASGGLGGGANTFAAARSQAAYDEAYRVAEQQADVEEAQAYNDALDAIKDYQLNNPSTQHFASFEDSLGPFQDYLNSSPPSGQTFGEAGFNTPADYSGGATIGGGTFQPSLPSSQSVPQAPSTPPSNITFGPGFGQAPDPTVNVNFGQSVLRSAPQPKDTTATKLARAGVGLYDLVNKLKRNNVTAGDVGRKAGGLISGVLSAPGRFLGGVRSGFSSSF